MCYHGSKAYTLNQLRERYQLPSVDHLTDQWQMRYHENGFDHGSSPVLVSPTSAGLFTWGLIPWFTKTVAEANIIRNQTLNCISEEMFDKPSYSGK